MTIKMKNSTTIFYVNSMGFMAQWKGQVIAKNVQLKNNIQYGYKCSG